MVHVLIYSALSDDESLSIKGYELFRDDRSDYVKRGSVRAYIKYDHPDDVKRGSVCTYIEVELGFISSDVMLLSCHVRVSE